MSDKVSSDAKRRDDERRICDKSNGFRQYPLPVEIVTHWQQELMILSHAEHDEEDPFKDTRKVDIV